MRVIGWRDKIWKWGNVSIYLICVFSFLIPSASVYYADKQGEYWVYIYVYNDDPIMFYSFIVYNVLWTVGLAIRKEKYFIILGSISLFFSGIYSLLAWLTMTIITPDYFPHIGGYLLGMLAPISFIILISRASLKQFINNN